MAKTQREAELENEIARLNDVIEDQRAEIRRLKDELDEATDSD